MPETAQTASILAAAAAASQSYTQTSPNGVRYATFGMLNDGALSVEDELPRLIGAVPAVMSAALANTVFYFVPLALIPAEGEPAIHPDAEVTIAAAYSTGLADRAICHRNVRLPGHDAVFLSARLQNDRFALAFEFFINAAHAFVDVAGVPEEYVQLIAQQVEANVRGEASHDAWDYRQKLASAPHDDKARNALYETAFVDALAIYMLSLYLDFDYADLREREYPLLIPAALAERLRCVHKLLPSNTGYTFEIRYRRR
ncbi:MAG: hypothetical protein JSS87_02885 [Acidobacteria bacterium]|nr:hypothetical protein [Acidobacteriota bacterium]